MRKRLVLCGVILLGLTLKSLGDQSDWQKELRIALQQVVLSERADKASFVKNERACARDITRALDLKTRCSAVLETWFFAENGDSLELAWWQSGDPSVRALIIAVYSAMRLEPISGVPPFRAYSGKFSDEEKEKRLSENNWAEEMATRKLIAKEILNWAERNLGSIEQDEFAAKKLAAYQEMANRP